ncbi:hypothetical protein [Hymenobacter nivis]|uniref:hypothetical protein n=1 Tax=Hymenobacter nivis TaxID=1850093 RepID=UPI001B862C80|nr:hypothetical protein [Hymenobacter nivis]
MPKFHPRNYTTTLWDYTVNVASIHAIATEALVAPYAAAKAAVLSLTRSAAIEAPPKRPAN